MLTVTPLEEGAYLFRFLWEGTDPDRDIQITCRRMTIEADGR